MPAAASFATLPHRFDLNGQRIEIRRIPTPELGESLPEDVFQLMFRNRRMKEITEEMMRKGMIRRSEDECVVLGCYLIDADGADMLIGTAMKNAGEELRGEGMIAPHVVVDAPFRRQGLGSRLYRLLMDGETRLTWLYTDSEQDAANGFLAHLGFPEPEVHIEVEWDVKTVVGQAEPPPEGLVFFDIARDRPELAPDFIAIRRRAFLNQQATLDLDADRMLKSTLEFDGYWTGALMHDEAVASLNWSVMEHENKAGIGDFFVKRKYWGSPIGLAMFYETAFRLDALGVEKAMAAIRSTNAAMMRLVKLTGAIETKRVYLHTTRPDAAGSDAGEKPPATNAP